jgi:hypothetical protein
MFEDAPGSSLLQIMRHYAPQIDDGRSLADSLRYAAGELKELADEIEAREAGKHPGPDGIVGEAIDVMVCMADIIVRAEPNFTDRDLTRLFDAKCRKWLRGFLPDTAPVKGAIWMEGETCRGRVEILIAPDPGHHDAIFGTHYRRTGYVQVAKVRDWPGLRDQFGRMGYIEKTGRPPLTLRDPVNRLVRAAGP